MSTWVSLPELADVLGRDGAHLLSRTLGGLSFYVPQNAQSAHTLARLVGASGMDALCAAFGGLEITVPNGRKPEAHKEKIIALLEGGTTRAEAARLCQVTERYVYCIAKELGRQKERQLRLPF